MIRRLKNQLSKLKQKLTKKTWLGGVWLNMAKEIDPDFNGTDADAVKFCGDHWRKGADTYTSPMAKKSNMKLASKGSEDVSEEAESAASEKSTSNGKYIDEYRDPE